MAAAVSKEPVKVLQEDVNRIIRARGGIPVNKDSWELIRIELGLTKAEWNRALLVWGPAAEGVKSRLNPQLYP